MINDGLFTSNSEEWSTPQAFFDELDTEFHFTLDPCSTDDNAKCEKHYTKEQDGLAQDWTGETVFCNPPYGRNIRKWCEKCYRHAQGGTRQLCSSMQGRTRHGFTNWYTGKRRFGSFAGGSTSAEANGMPRFRQWLPYIDRSLTEVGTVEV